MSIVIRAERLSKSYHLGPQQNRDPYLTFRDVLVSGAAGAWSRLRNPRAATRSRGRRGEEFWALSEVDFDIRQGDRVGIVGRNGAGKSTLLKVLSRITDPTRGRLAMRGRIASLLEVGTGFHPELTGRENIFLNGAILGMTRPEIRAKFDEIVAFAEVERFLDTPVKRYSSGMYVRLAFAVAAHLEPEILIVDEVLAVGDVEFQRKCLGKMDEAGRSGRTVLFVSHNMEIVQRLCHRGILLHEGRVQADGPMADVAAEYLRRGRSEDRYVNTIALNEHAYFLEAEVVGAEVSPGEWLREGRLGLRVRWVNVENKGNLRLGIALGNAAGVQLANISPTGEQMTQLQRRGSYEAVVTFPRDVLLPGEYNLILCLYEANDAYHLVEPALNFEVVADASRSISDSRATGMFYLESDFLLTNIN